MIEKQFKTLDEQIQIFKHKGLVIKDERYAKEVLLRENYFFINGYRHPKQKRYLYLELHLKNYIAYFYLTVLLEMFYSNTY